MVLLTPHLRVPVDHGGRVEAWEVRLHVTGSGDLASYYRVFGKALVEMGCVCLDVGLEGRRVWYAAVGAAD
jgi:hypothetical protein